MTNKICIEDGNNVGLFGNLAVCKKIPKLAKFRLENIYKSFKYLPDFLVEKKFVIEEDRA